MGYRDLSLFNLALLDKQGWQIVQNDNSLLHKIYKENIFQKPHSLRHIWGKIHHTLGVKFEKQNTNSTRGAFGM